MAVPGVVARGIGTNAIDGVEIPTLGGKHGEDVVTDLHGRGYTANVRGLIYTASTPVAGVAIPKYDTTAPVFSIWNPAGSGKNLELLTLDIGFNVLGTRVVSNILLMGKTGVGATIATGGPISAFAETPTGILGGVYGGSGPTSVVKFSNAGTVTLGTAGGVARVLPFSHDLATGGSYPVMTYDFKGEFVLAPGAMIYLASNPAATGSTYDVSLTWAEYPTV
jgi:hypothetical protein